MTTQLVLRPPRFAYFLHLVVWPTVCVWILVTGAGVGCAIKGGLVAILCVPMFGISLLGCWRVAHYRLVVKDGVMKVGNPPRTYVIDLAKNPVELHTGPVSEGSGASFGTVIRQAKGRSIAVFATEFYSLARRREVVAALNDLAERTEGMTVSVPADYLR